MDSMYLCTFKYLFIYLPDKSFEQEIEREGNVYINTFYSNVLMYFDTLKL